MKIKELGNTALVRLCARETSNRNAWLEFHSRFNQRISLVLLRECKNRGLFWKTPESDELIQDLIQDVYIKLVDKDCNALKNFKGNSENAIYIYLGMICRNIVINHIIKSNAQKRPQIQASIDEKMTGHSNDSGFTLKDVLEIPSEGPEQHENIAHMQEKIETILNRRITGKNCQRDKIIFKLYLYEEMTPEEISGYFNYGITSKSVSNIISITKSEIRNNWK